MAVSPASSRWSVILGAVAQADIRERREEKAAKNSQPHDIGHALPFASIPPSYGRRRDTPEAH